MTSDRRIDEAASGGTDGITSGPLGQAISARFVGGVGGFDSGATPLMEGRRPYLRPRREAIARSAGGDCASGDYRATERRAASLYDPSQSADRTAKMAAPSTKASRWTLAIGRCSCR